MWLRAELRLTMKKMAAHVHHRGTARRRRRSGLEPRATPAPPRGSTLRALCAALSRPGDAGSRSCSLRELAARGSSNDEAHEQAADGHDEAACNHLLERQLRQLHPASRTWERGSSAVSAQRAASSFVLVWQGSRRRARSCAGLESCSLDHALTVSVCRLGLRRQRLEARARTSSSSASSAHAGSACPSTRRCPPSASASVPSTHPLRAARMGCHVCRVCVD